MPNVRSTSTRSPAAALLAIGLLAAPVPAQLEQQFAQCAGESDTAPALRIDACSALIASNALDPINLAAAYDNRGNAYAAEHDLDRAVDAYNHALVLRPNDVPTLDSRGLAFAKLGQFDRAIADFNRAIKLNLNYAAVYYNRGIARQRGSDSKGGAADIAKAQQIDPGIASR